MEDTSAEESSYYSDASEHCGDRNETSVDLDSSVDWLIEPSSYAVLGLPEQAHRHEQYRRQSDDKSSSNRAIKEEFSKTPSKHMMRLRTYHLLSTIAGQPRGRKFHSLSPPHMILRHNGYFKFQLRSASAPNLTFMASANQAPPEVRKGWKCLPTRRAMKKRQRSPVTGNPDDLEDWEWDDPIVRRLADAVFAIREERKLTMQRLEAIDEKIEALRQNLVEKDAA